jgi:hypothetical protein
MLETNGQSIKKVYNYKLDRMLQKPIADSVPELLRFTRAYIQQYNNRMLDNNLVVKAR